MPRRRPAGAVPAALKPYETVAHKYATRERNGMIERQQLDRMENGNVWCVACCNGFTPLAGVPLDDMTCPRGHGLWYVDGFATVREKAKVVDEVPEPTPVASTAQVAQERAPVLAPDAPCRCGRPREDEDRKTCRTCRARAAKFHERRRARKASA